MNDSCWLKFTMRSTLLSLLCFFGVFQNDPGPPNYALELRDYVKYMFFLHFTLCYSLELKVRKVKFRCFKTASKKMS